MPPTEPASPAPPAPAAEPDRAASPPQRRGLAVRALGAVHRLAEKGWATSAVGAWAFLQASVVPGPVDAVLIPLGIADPPRAFRFAWAAVLGSTLGALVAYAIGALAFDSVGLAMLGTVGLDAGDVERLRSTFQVHGWTLPLFQWKVVLPAWTIVLASTLTPISAKLTSIAAGLFGIPLPEFVLAFASGRAFRFLVVAAVCRYAGDRVERWIERRYGLTLDEIAARGRRAG